MEMGSALRREQGLKVEALRVTTDKEEVTASAATAAGQ
jgi:hypothetical protein